MYPNEIHDFSLRFRTGSNPADNNWFQSHTGINNYSLMGYSTPNLTILVDLVHMLYLLNS